MAGPPRRRDDQQATARAARAQRSADTAALAGILLASFRLPERATEPESVVAHLGPTNSGKSHDALAFLAAHGAGTFAAPLRLLAHEARLKLLALVPPGTPVGLVTGEERIDPHAAIVCCTTELAPLSGEVLVLDEVHWVSDPDRGWAWGRLLAAAAYRHIRLVGALNAEPVLRAAFGDRLEIRRHQRLVELHWGGTVDLLDVPGGSLVVAFSRKAVLALARDLSLTRRTGVLYGALPPGARKAQIERFLAGELDTLVVTDVIGHGINLPAHAVVMAETSKFDGTRRRPLHLWELAQIVGRAGRFGLAERGESFVLRGMPGLDANASLVRQATEAAGGQRSAGPGITTAPIRPTLADLEVATATELAEVVDAWQSGAQQALAGHPWLRAAPLDRLAGLIGRFRREGLLAALGDASTVWRLATTSIDDEDLVVELARDLALGGARRPRPPVIDPSSPPSLEDAERAAARARGLAAMGRNFPELATASAEELLAVEDAAARRIVEVLPAAIAEASFGRCGSCGRPCPPYAEVCDRCRGSGPRLPPPKRGGRGPGRKR